MKSRNLVPKVITDKNGVKTSRWVKPDMEAKDVSASIPAATVAAAVSPPEHDRMVADLTEKIQKCDPSAVPRDTALEAVQKMDNSTLAALAGYVDGSEDNLDCAVLWIDLYESKEPYLRELFTYHSAIDPSTDNSFVEEAIYYLHEYEELPKMEDYSQADPELQQTIRNLLGITETYIAEEYENDREGNDPILPPELRRLVIERPESAERINSILLIDPDTDPERIKMMLDSESASLVEGIL